MNVYVFTVLVLGTKFMFVKEMTPTLGRLDGKLFIPFYKYSNTTRVNFKETERLTQI